VNLEDLDSIGAQSINTAIDRSDVVVVDEIGPMELFSAKFKEAAKKALENDKLVNSGCAFQSQGRTCARSKKQSRR
jgi:nucleoside-triphosphatase